jgi:HlyD family secretion protein
MNAISRPRRYGVWILVLLAIAGGGYYWSRQAKKTEVVTMDKTAVTRGDLIESISSTGTLSALEEVTVGSQGVSGIITQVLVDFNSQVKKGDLLAIIDPKTLQAQVDVANATMAQRQVSYDEAKLQLEEGQRLYEQKYISDRDLRALEVAARNAKTQLESATVDFSNRNVQLQYAQIRSPIDGVILTRSVDPGNTVAASMQAPTLFVVASDLTKMKILASVDETQIADIKEGMKAHFTVSGIPNKIFNAAVRQVRLKSTVTNNVVTYTVVLDAENPEKLLFPGMTATIDFIQSSIENALLIPTASLRVRVPNEMRIAKDQEDPAASAAGQAGQRSSGQNGSFGGMAGQFMGQAGAPGRGGAPGGVPGAGGRGRRGAVWMVNAEGKAYRVPVRILGADLTTSAVEPMDPETLKDGDEVITRVTAPTSASSAGGANSSQNAIRAPGGFGGNGGFGGGRGPG